MNPTIVTMDFETRSTIDLRRVGAWRYAEEPTTEVMCLAYCTDDGPIFLWVPRKFRERLPEKHGLPLMSDRTLTRLIANNSFAFEAHNAEFERSIWYHVMYKRHGFSDIPIPRWRCSAARAAMHSLPRDLARAGQATGLAVQKDDAGHRLMLQMCKPRKARKADLATLLEAGKDPETEILWKEEPEDLCRLFEYCVQDVATEHALGKKLLALPPLEQKIWELDQTINQRGLLVDTETIKDIIKMVASYTSELKTEFKGITKCAPTQVGLLLAWLKEQGLELDNLQKGTVKKIMETDMAPEVRRALEIRQSLGRSATAKHQALVRMAGSDDRVRGTMLYHGAGTGRWSGKGFQPHNLYRGDFEDFEPAIALIKGGNLAALEMLYGDPMSVASTLVRPMVIAGEGMDLIACDESAIEARGVAWLAGEEKVLDIFRGHGKIYEAAAVDVFKASNSSITVDTVTKWQRQIGKVVILACGYQGHVGAFQSMAKNYGVEVDDERAAEIVNNWRDNNQEIVNFWYALEEVAINAITNPKKLVTAHRGIKFAVQGGYLLMRLPSGRCLFYASPGTRMREHPTTGHIKQGICYWGMNQMTNQWGRQDTYGGKLAENATQAMCRDILAEAMLRVERPPYEIIMHVHDEIVVQVPEGEGSVEEIERLMTVVPKWAEGLPIAAEGWRGKRYHK